MDLLNKGQQEENSDVVQEGNFSDGVVYELQDVHETSKPPVVKKRYLQKARSAWLEDELLKDWLMIDERDLLHVSCRFCNKKLDAKRYSIDKHMGSKRHIEAAAQYGYTYTTIETSEPTEDIVFEDHIEYLEEEEDLPQQTEVVRTQKPPRYVEAHVDYRSVKLEPDDSMEEDPTQYSIIIHPSSRSNAVAATTISAGGAKAKVHSKTSVATPRLQATPHNVRPASPQVATTVPPPPPPPSKSAAEGKAYAYADEELLQLKKSKLRMDMQLTAIMIYKIRLEVLEMEKRLGLPRSVHTLQFNDFDVYDSAEGV